QFPPCNGNGISLSTGSGAVHNVDPRWQLGTSPSYPVSPVDEPGWYQPPPAGSAWIHADDTAATSTQALTSYAYSTGFTVPAGWNNVALNMQFAADNGVTFDLTGPSFSNVAFTGVSG